MARGNNRGGRGSGPRGSGAHGFRGAGGFRGPMRGGPRGRGGFSGPMYDDEYYGPHMMPPIPPQRFPPPPMPPIPPRPFMRGMPPMRRPPLPLPPLGGFRPPVPPIRPPRMGFIGSMRGRGRGGRVLKVKNAINGGGVPGGFKKGVQSKEKMMNVEIKKPWVTPELEAEIRKKYDLLTKSKATPSEEATKAFKDQEAIATNLNVQLRTTYTKGKEAFSCEACSRGYPSEEALSAHLAEHVTCGIDGCTLSAHPGIVELHVKFQHRTGLFKQINSAEDDKWLEDRKKRFPTIKNVTEKEKAKAEMIERGETYPAVNTPFKSWNRIGFDQTSPLNKEKGSSEAAPSNAPTKRTVNTAVMVAGRDAPDVPRRSRTRRKRPLKTDGGDVGRAIDKRENKDEEHCFVKMKKFSGLGMLLASVSNQNKDEITKEAMHAEGVDKKESTLSENTSNMDPKSNKIKPVVKSSTNENELTSKPDETCDTYPNRELQSFKMSSIEEMDTTCETNSNMELQSSIIEDTACETNSNMKLQSSIIEETDTACESNSTIEPPCKKVETEISCENIQSVEPKVLHSSHIENSNEKKNTIVLTNTLIDNALADLMSSYMGGGDTSDDDAPLETGICKDEVEFQQSLNNRGQNRSTEESKCLNGKLSGLGDGKVENECNDKVDFIKSSGDTSDDDAQLETGICKDEVEFQRSLNNWGQTRSTEESKCPNRKLSGLGDEKVDTVFNDKDDFIKCSSEAEYSNLANVHQNVPDNILTEGNAGRSSRNSLDVKCVKVAVSSDPFDCYKPTRCTLRRHRGTGLLEKLLEEDIVHERNVILQCVHHVVSNNFFDQK